MWVFGHYFISNAKPLKVLTKEMMWPRTIVRQWCVGWFGEGTDDVRGGIRPLLRLGVGHGGAGKVEDCKTTMLDVVSLVVGRKVVSGFQKVSLLEGEAGRKRGVVDFNMRLEPESWIRRDSEVTAACTLEPVRSGLRLSFRHLLCGLRSCG